jgi:hypothetical protein
MQGSLRDKLIGAWRLVDVVKEAADGSPDVRPHDLREAQDSAVEVARPGEIREESDRVLPDDQSVETYQRPGRVSERLLANIRETLGEPAQPGDLEITGTWKLFA